MRQLRVAQMFADEGLGPDVHRLGTDAIEHRVGFAQRQQQQVDQRIGDARGVVGRQAVGFIEGGEHKVVRDPAGAVARRKLARRHFRRVKTAFAQQFLRDDDDLVPRQGRADDRMRAGYVVGETIARHDVDAAAGLLEMRNPVGLEQDLDEGVLAQFRPGSRMRNAMLARLDLAQLQLRNGGVIDPRLKRRGLHRVDIELTAEIGQCI